MLQLPDDERKRSITAFYQNLLEREPDLPGLRMYYNSDLTLKEIENDIGSSLERQALVQKRQSGPVSGSPAVLGKERLIIGDCPTNDAEVHQVLKVGADVVVNVGPSEEVPYDKSSFLEHVFLPVAKEGKGLSSTSCIEECLRLLKRKALDENKRVYVHSTERDSPVCVALAALFSSLQSSIPVDLALCKLVLRSQGMLNFKKGDITPDMIRMLTELKREYFPEYLSSGNKDKDKERCCGQEPSCCKGCSGHMEEEVCKERVHRLFDGVFCGPVPNVDDIKDLKMGKVSRLISVDGKHTYDKEVEDTFEKSTFSVKGTGEIPEMETLAKIKKIVKEEVDSGGAVYLHSLSEGHDLVFSCLAASSAVSCCLEDMVKAIEDYFSGMYINERTLETGLKVLTI